MMCAGSDSHRHIKHHTHYLQAHNNYSITTNRAEKSAYSIVGSIEGDDVSEGLNDGAPLGR